MLIFRYVIADDRVLFQLKDGSIAFEIRDFLVTQDTCLTVTFEQLEFKCKPKKNEFIKKLRSNVELY